MEQLVPLDACGVLRANEVNMGDDGALHAPKARENLFSLLVLRRHRARVRSMSSARLAAKVAGKHERIQNPQEFLARLAAHDAAATTIRSYTRG
jgi:hypothetical protein